MFIAHIPAGYILTKKIQSKYKIKKYLFLGLIASILPDIDIIYFYLIDNRQKLHHLYWIHTPFYWLLFGIVIYFVILLLKKTKYKIIFYIFFSNIFLHLLLDTFVGKILWFYPIYKYSFSFFSVPAVYNFWVSNFIFHWTFLFEIIIIIYAANIFFKQKKH